MVGERVRLRGDLCAIYEHESVVLIDRTGATLAVLSFALAEDLALDLQNAARAGRSDASNP